MACCWAILQDPSAVAHAVRAAADEDFSAMSFLSTVGKGKPVKGIVEAVLNGSTLRLTLPEHGLQQVTVALAGVQCPSMGKRAAAPAAPAAEGGAGGGELTAAAAAASVPAAAAEPFAREAKWFSEVRVLNREVRVVLEGVDKYNNLFGSVVFPEGEGDKLGNLAEQLAAAGLAKVGGCAGDTRVTPQGQGPPGKLSGSREKGGGAGGRFCMSM
jgi:staphylococcal nuclease domain-containing protein 1